LIRGSLSAVIPIPSGAGRARAGSEILSLDKRATLFIDAPSHVVNDPFREERLVWRKIEQPEADKFGLETKA
jgi:hypothetical protein